MKTEYNQAVSSTRPTQAYRTQTLFTAALLLWMLLFQNHLQAQPPAGYYNSATGTGATLKTSLYNIIKDHTPISYDNLWEAFKVTDVKPDGKIWDMYSNCSGTGQCGTFNAECQCYNREHSFPKDWFGGDVNTMPMYTDLFHLIPTDGAVNAMRSNYPYGTVSSPTYTSLNGGSKVGPCSYPGYTGTVFEPVDEYKGDLARNYFYMATRYQDVISTWDTKSTVYSNNPVLQPNSFPVFETWFLNMLGEWSANDPVSQKEIDRNNAVYAIQHNRNPYIDHPEYIYQVWGVGALKEPTNFPTDFSARNIHLQWTDATGTTIPEGYLVRMSTSGFDAIAAPDDGTTYSTASDFYVPAGQQSLWVKNLSASTMYYFKIYSYAGSGQGIKYYTEGTVPQVQQRTGE